MGLAMPTLKISSRDLVKLYLDDGYGQTATELHRKILEGLEERGFRSLENSPIITMPSIRTALRYLERDGKVKRQETISRFGRGDNPTKSILWFAL